MLSVLITGSRAEDAGVTEEEFVAACERVGKWLYGKHKIIVAATLANYADHHAFNGALAAFNLRASASNARFDIELFSAKHDETSKAQMNPMLEGLEALTSKGVSGILIHRKGNDAEAWQEAIEASDIVLVLGGNKRPITIYTMALRARKPVLGATWLGGVGKRVMIELRQVYQLVGITEDHTYVLNEASDGDHKRGAFLTLLQAVVDRNPWAASHASTSRLTFLALVVLGLLWIILFGLAHGLTPIPVEKWYYWPAPLCMIAGMIGGAGRTLLSRPTPTQNVSASIMLNSGAGLAAGLSIATFIAMVVASVIYGPKNEAGIPYMTFVFVLGAGLSAAVGLWGLEALERIAKVAEKLPHH